METFSHRFFSMLVFCFLLLSQAYACKGPRTCGVSADGTKCTGHGGGNPCGTLGTGCKYLKCEPINSFKQSNGSMIITKCGTMGHYTRCKGG